MRWVDLHVHSSVSDGADTPAHVVARAHALGMAAVALTDHDSIAGLDEARAATASFGLKFLTGVELSAQFEKQELHILGLGIDPASPTLQALLENSQYHRKQRVHYMLQRLEILGVVSRDVINERFEGSIPSSRMHVAAALAELKKAPSVQGAFERYLNPGCPAFVPKELPQAQACIDVIHAAGGLAFIAHPGLGNLWKKRLGALLELPFDGLEAWHSSHAKAWIQTMCALAQERGLLVTGGSDCHGEIKKEKPTMGRVKTPYWCFERIRDCLENRA